MNEFELVGTAVGLLAYGAACLWVGTIVERVRIKRRKRTALGQADVVLSMFDKANAETAARNAGV